MEPPRPIFVWDMDLKGVWVRGGVRYQRRRGGGHLPLSTAGQKAFVVKA